MTQQNQTAPVKQESVIGLLNKYRAQIEAALPTHMSPDRMIRIITTEIHRNPILKDCDPISFMGAVVQASQLGLEPGLQGHAYLIPYWNKKRGVREVQFQPGYKGLMDLAYRSGRVNHIDAHAVYENDYFEFQYGTDAFLKHQPADGERGELIKFYAVAALANGSSTFKVMSKADVDKVKAKSQAADSDFSPWNDPIIGYIEMGKKTPIIRVCKYLPSSPEDRDLGIAVAAAERADSGIAQDNRALLAEVSRLIDKPSAPIVPQPGQDDPEAGAGEGKEEKGGKGPGNKSPGKKAGKAGQAASVLSKKKEKQGEQQQEADENVDPETGEVVEPGQSAMGFDD